MRGQPRCITPHFATRLPSKPLHPSHPLSADDLCSAFCRLQASVALQSCRLSTFPVFPASCLPSPPPSSLPFSPPLTPPLAFPSRLLSTLLSPRTPATRLPSSSAASFLYSSPRISSSSSLLPPPSPFSSTFVRPLLKDAREALRKAAAGQLRRFKPTTPSLRHTVLVDKRHLWKGRPVKALTVGLRKTGGRSRTTGRITVRHRGGGGKRLYRFIDFKRQVLDAPGRVERIEYDPNRSAFIALISYQHTTHHLRCATSSLLRTRCPVTPSSQAARARWSSRLATRALSDSCRSAPPCTAWSCGRGVVRSWRAGRVRAAC